MQQLPPPCEVHQHVIMYDRGCLLGGAALGINDWHYKLQSAQYIMRRYTFACTAFADVLLEILCLCFRTEMSKHVLYGSRCMSDMFCVFRAGHNNHSTEQRLLLAPRRHCINHLLLLGLGRQMLLAQNTFSVSVHQTWLVGFLAISP